MNRDKWRQIRAEIEQDIMDGVLPAGAKLPTEPELVAVYDAGRHSVRRAITDLAKDGLLSVEQGRGTFVQPRPVLEYSIGTRTRLRPNLAPQGVDVSSENLGVEHVQAGGSIAADLGLETGAPVIASGRMTLADGIPISFGTLYHDASRFAEFPERRAVLGSVSAVYKSYGIDDYLRGSTQLNARPARASEAQRLRQHPDMPVIVIRAVDTLLDGTPIACSRVIWSAARVKFNVPNKED
ncbi:MAG: phosphonate metabolism transcriptional regulator PhnF [Proteobacteria bacterium]|nr:phosphonate metabolism transcriptional regulator PhnF [Pseudomonadota bacterium]